MSAYYYLWFYTETGCRSQLPIGEGKWKGRYTRALLNPPQYPLVGEYVSNDPVVIETQIEWAADLGIDCFICEWEGMNGHRSYISRNLVQILQGDASQGTYSANKIRFSSHDSLETVGTRLLGDGTKQDFQ